MKQKIELENVLEFFSPGWSKKEINGQKFDDLFHIDGVPLSWFYERLLCKHTIPGIFNLKESIQKLEKGETIHFDIQKQKITTRLKRLHYLNEQGKIFFTKVTKKTKKTKTAKTLFLTFPEHINPKTKEVSRIHGLIQQIKNDKIMEPFLLTASPTSQKISPSFFSILRSQNIFYSYINSRDKIKAMNIAKRLELQWNTLKNEQKILLCGSESVWNCLRYPLDLYFSKEFIYFIALYYYTAIRFIEENNIQSVVLTAYNSIMERCLSAAASKHNVHTILIQHGYGQGSVYLNMLPPYKIAVFSDKYKQKLIEKGIDGQNIIITGALIFDSIIKFVNLPKSQTKKKTILITTEPDVEQGLIARKDFFTKVTKIVQDLSAIEGCEIIIKLHPRQKKLPEYEKIKEKNKEATIEIIPKSGSEHLYNLITKSDVVINIGLTTVALESLILDKPVILIDLTKHNLKFAAEIVQTKSVLEISPEVDAGKVVSKLFIKDTLKEQRKKAVQDLCGIIDGKTSERIAFLLYQLNKGVSDSKNI